MNLNPNVTATFLRFVGDELTVWRVDSYFL